MFPDQKAAALSCHRATPCPWVKTIQVSLSFDESGALSLTYLLKGEIARLRSPSRQPPRQADELWKHTCFEAFIAVAGTPAYRELNFSPSGLWALYAFSDYRQRTESAIAAPPRISLRQRDDDGLQLDAVVARPLLPAAPAGATLELGLAAVIEDANGELSYWALRHDGARPDFHRRDGFILNLAVPEARGR